MDLWLLPLLLINETDSRTRKTGEKKKLTSENDDQMRSVRFIATIFAEHRLKCVGNEIENTATESHRSGRVS